METEHLRQFELLRHLSDQQLIVLASKSTMLHLKPGEPLFDAGETDPYEYYLMAGEVDIKPADDSFIKTLTANSPHAMGPVARGRPRPYTVTAHSAAALMRIEADTLKSLLQDAPGDHYEVKKALRQDQPEDKQLLLDIYTDLRNNKLVLPSLPEVAVKIRGLIDDGNNSAKVIAEAVNTDPAIATKIIKASNSPLFRGTREFETSMQAIVRLGMQTTKQLVTSFTLKELFKASHDTLKQHMDALWQHSIEIAAVSYVLAKHMPKMDPEQALLAGLLHDIGVVPILMYADQYPSLVENIGLLDKTIKELKPDLGNVMLKRWNFSDDMAIVAANSENWSYQHEGPANFADLVIVAHLHHALADQAKQEKLEKVPAFKKLFPAENPTAELRQILAQAQEQLEHTRQLLTA